jgi:hypothetical protein
VNALQVGRRLHPEFGAEHSANLAVGAQRVPAPAGSLQRDHELGVQPFVVRMGLDQRFQLRDELAVIAEPHFCAQPQLKGQHAHFLEVRDIALQQAPVLYSGKRGTTPQTERLTQQYRGFGDLTCHEQCPSVLGHALELHAIQLTIRHVDDIAGGSGADGLARQALTAMSGYQLAKLIDISLRSGHRGARWAIVPQFGDQGIEADDLVSPEKT